MTTPITPAGIALFTDMEPGDMWESNGVTPEDIARVEAEARAEGAATATSTERLARARHRWQHPTYTLGVNKCGCPGWAATVREMLDLLEHDEAAVLAAIEGESK